MRSTIFLGAAALIGLIATDPALCMQAAPPPPADQVPSVPGEPEDPNNPNPAPMPDPSQPNPPITEPLPPEMPMPAAEAPPAPPAQPMVMNREAPIGPMATPPDAGATSATSGGTTAAMMQPQPATKEYPPCSKTLQDNCRNAGEGPKRVAAKKPR